MKTKTIKLTVVLMLILSIFVMPIWAQTADEIASEADNATTDFFNQALKEKKTKFESNKINNETKIEKNKIEFRSKIDSINNVSEERISTIIKDDLIKNDTKLFIETRDILEAEIVVNNEEITTITEEISSLKIFLKADLPRRLDSITDNESLKKNYIESIEKAIKNAENIKGNIPMQKNYPNYDLFSVHFGEAGSKSYEQKNELNYKMEENLKRESEILRLIEVKKILTGRKERFINEEKKMQDLLKKEANAEKESNDAIIESDRIKKDALLCLEDLEKYRIKLSSELDDEGTRIIFKNCSGKTRTMVKTIFRKHRLEEPTISAYDGTNEEMITVAKNKLESLIEN